MSRILVVTKFRYLGDTIVATPFLRRLKEARPDDEITLLSGPAMPGLLRGCPYLKDIIPFEPKGENNLQRNLRLMRELRERRFDTAYLVNRSLHTALVAFGARIPRRVGFDTEHRGRLLTLRVAYDWEKPDRDCALDLLRSEGIAAEPALPELWLEQEERQAARDRLAAAGIGPEDLLVGIQPGAHDPEVREWGAEKFAETAERLAAESGARIVLLGSREERGVSDRVVALAAKARPVTLTGETGLREALAMISLCRLWIGNDGGLLHAAVALGPATVGIFGPTKAPRWGYDSQRHRTMVVYPGLPAGDHDTIRRCLDAISVDEVYDTACCLLEGEQ